MLTLLAACRSLDDYQRAQVEAIAIETASAGYEARLELQGLFPAGDLLAGREVGARQVPEGVSCNAMLKRNPIRFVLDWRVPAWQQILELIHDPEMSKPEYFGTMEAAERTTAEDVSGRAERDCSWYVVTHGAARSKERAAWVVSNL